MVDADTGTVLYAKNPDALFPPASLAKLMTMEVVFHAIKEGRYSLDDMFTVSENAWRTGGAPSGGSTMFAKPNSTLRLGDLIQGVIIQSANDGCIAIAEGIAGSEERFAVMMTERARAIGLKQSFFRNATGLPADGQVVNARELVDLAMHIWRTYPEFYKFYAQREFTWNKITQRNRNPLLAMAIGADGMMTGSTDESGFAIVGSTDREGRRTFVALSGLSSDRQRSDEARAILDWGMTEFRKTDLFTDGAVIGQAEMFGGEKAALALKAGGPVAVLLPAEDKEPVSARIIYNGPVPAPVIAGAAVGRLEVWTGDTLRQQTPLYAAETVHVGAVYQRAYDAMSELMTGWMRKAPST